MEGRGEKATMVDHINMCSGVEAMDVDGGVGAQPQAPKDEMEAVLETLLRNATEEFGFAPRDVYNGVFDLPGMKDQHTAAVKSLDYSKLMTLSKTFSNNCELDHFSHHVVAVHVRNVPVPLTYSSAPAGLELATVKPVAGYLGVYGVFGVHGVHGVHGELTRPPFVAHPSTQDIKTTRGLRHGTKHRRLCAQTMIKGCLVGFLGDSHRDVTGLGYYISCCSNALYSLDLIS